MKTLAIALLLLLPGVGGIAVPAESICMPKEYVLICESGEEVLNQKVNSYLAKGWYIYGNPIIAGNGMDQVCQAVVRF